MLTSAGGILALLKDQNQVFHFKVRYFIKLNLLQHECRKTKNRIIVNFSLRRSNWRCSWRSSHSRSSTWSWTSSGRRSPTRSRRSRYLKNFFSILVYNFHQVVSEDDLYPAEVRQQAALVASKVGDSSWSVWLLNGCSGVLPPWLIRRFPAICSGCCHSLRHLRHS